jgi:hypothetical protein
MRYEEPEPPKALGPAEMIVAFIVCIIILGFLIHQFIGGL